MSLLVQKSVNSLLISIYKNLTLFVFFILPAKVSNIFISLSILSLIYNVRNIDIKEYPISTDKFKTLLNVSFNEEIMLLPQYTVHWFWKESFLDENIQLGNSNVTIREALQKDEFLYTHLRAITDHLINNIPSLLKYKLNLKDTKSRLIVKHNVMTLLINT